jgi:hypothetical protein
MDSKIFEKLMGFARPPVAPISGSFAVYSHVIEADMKCHACGRHVLVRLKGDTRNYDEQRATKAIVEAVRKKHDCPAVRDTLVAKAHKFFADFRRGKEKKQEADHFAQKAGIDTRDKPITKKQIEDSRKNKHGRKAA